MYSYDRRHASLYRRLFVAMSMEEAKAVLGFPPGASPSPTEVNKAYKQKAVENHPDRGGSHEKMVEINVAKEILEGRRREDRTPYRPSPSPPAVDPEVARRREHERSRQQAFDIVATEAKETMEALEPALREIDFAPGRLHLPSFLTQDFGRVLDKLHNEIEVDSTQTPDVLRAKAYIHSLTGMSLRLATRATAITKRHGEAYASLVGMGGDMTWKYLELMHTEMGKFRVAFHEFYVESGKLMGLIRTSELLPVSWDDTYWEGHKVVVSFEEDFKGTSDHAMKAFADRLKKAVSSIEGVLFGFGYKKRIAWQAWRLPGDFMKAAEVLRSAKR